MTRRLGPYSVAIVGALLITSAIAVISSRASVPGLSAFYLLLVLWLGARWGIGPAVAGSVAAFLLYDYFFVPPIGTFTVSGPKEFLELVVLLAVALVTGQLAASLRRTQSSAEVLAAESRALYELATAALRSPEVTIARSLLRERATRLEAVNRFDLVAMDFGQVTPLSGSELNADETRQAAWSYENRTPIGIAVSDGVVKPVRTLPP